MTMLILHWVPKSYYLTTTTTINVHGFHTTVNTTIINTSSNGSGGSNGSSSITVATAGQGTFFFLYICTILIFSFFFFLQVLPTTTNTATFINTSSNRSGGTGSNSRIRDSRHVASRVPGMFFFFIFCTVLMVSFIFFLQVLPTATNEDHGARDESRSPSVSFFFSFSFGYYTNCLVFYLQVLTRSTGNEKAQETRRTSLGPLYYYNYEWRPGPRPVSGP